MRLNLEHLFKILSDEGFIEFSGTNNDKIFSVRSKRENGNIIEVWKREGKWLLYWFLATKSDAPNPLNEGEEVGLTFIQLMKQIAYMLDGSKLVALDPKDERYNWGIRCDMSVGPCACGEWHSEKEAKEAYKRSRMYKPGDLYNADPNCDHNIIDSPGGGVKCTKCTGWFCL